MEKKLQFEPVITDEQMRLYDDLKNQLIIMSHHFNRPPLKAHKTGWFEEASTRGCTALELLDKDWFAKDLSDRLHRLGYKKGNV